MSPALVSRVQLAGELGTTDCGEDHQPVIGIIISKPWEARHVSHLCKLQEPLENRLQRQFTRVLVT